MKIKFTNWFNNKNKSEQKSSDIDIKGDCVITNYDTRERSHSKSGDLTIKVNDKDVSIMQKSTDAGNNQVNMNKNKYSIFTTLSGLDGNNKDLTQDDLSYMNLCYKVSKMKKEDAKKKFNLSEEKYNEMVSNWKKFSSYGASEVRYDENAGVATISFGEDELLRIDFETDYEKNIAKKEASKTQQSQATTETNTSTQTQTNVADIIAEFKGGAIDISKVKDMATVAKYTGMSESYIKDILVGIEGKKKYPVLTSEYDNVPSKGHPKGHLTVGFGHTSLTGEPKVTENMTITEQEAYQILANDIITAKTMAQRKLGTLYSDAPKSIQDAIVDLVFNKGPSAINGSLKANLQEGYYHSAARRTWYETDNVGLQKRNVYRFLAAIKGLDKDDKANAVKNFYNEHSPQLRGIFKKDIDAQTAWNSMCEKNKLSEYSYTAPPQSTNTEKK